MTADPKSVLPGGIWFEDQEGCYVSTLARGGMAAVAVRRGRVEYRHKNYHPEAPPMERHLAIEAPDECAALRALATAVQAAGWPWPENWYVAEAAEAAESGEGGR